MNATMTATLIREHGGPERLVIETVARPRPGAGEVVVRVAACALNHLDIFVRRGMPGVVLSLPHTTGGDIAGWVEELGPGVEGQRSGRRCWSIRPCPTERLARMRPAGSPNMSLVPADNLIALQHSDRLIEMAALPIAYGTAQRMLLTRAALRPGETLVVVGASGGVGVACVQLGKRAGARVIACTSSAAKANRLRNLGADEWVVADDGVFSRRCGS